MGRFLFSAALVTVLACLSCTPAAIGGQAAQGAFDQVTSPEATKRLDNMAEEVAAAARDEVFSQATYDAAHKAAQAAQATLQPMLRSALQQLVDDALAQFRVHLPDIVQAALHDALRDSLRDAVRAALDEALGSTTKAEVAGLIYSSMDVLTPRLVSAATKSATAAAQAASSAAQQGIQAELVPLKTEADKEAAKWMPIAVGFGVGTVALLVALLFLVHTLRAHRALIERLMYPSGR